MASNQDVHSLITNLCIFSMMLGQVDWKLKLIPPIWHAWIADEECTGGMYIKRLFHLKRRDPYDVIIVMNTQRTRYGFGSTYCKNYSHIQTLLIKYQQHHPRCFCPLLLDESNLFLVWFFPPFSRTQS